MIDYGEAGNLAVIVKLTRTLMIVPVTLTLAVYTSGKPILLGLTCWIVLSLTSLALQFVLFGN